MAQVVYPFNPQNGDDADVSLLDANLQIVAVQVNGNLEAGVNVRTASPVVQTSASGLSEGSANTLLRSDAQFVIRGMERLASDPATNNDVGREYFNTATLQKRMCIDTTGSGTWVTTGNGSANDVANHAARHKTGGPDALLANSVDGTMLARSGFTTGVPTADITVSAGGWTDVVTGLTVTTSGASGQSCLFIINVEYNVTNSNTPIAHFRLQDDTPTTVWRTGSIFMGSNASNSQADYSSFIAPVNVVGTKIFKFQAIADSTGFQVVKSMSTVSESGPATVVSVLVG